ncbi:MAG: hypothetical protein KDD10_22445 [Phaeodactylibacter sp.]|nr:hypothetical protein [Phaeodactylibacter sp.]MCB9294580.1 hypothetical protein [Lewinellaceae bacterium]
MEEQNPTTKYKSILRIGLVLILILLFYLFLSDEDHSVHNVIRRALQVLVKAL